MEFVSGRRAAVVKNPDISIKGIIIIYILLFIFSISDIAPLNDIFLNRINKLLASNSLPLEINSITSLSNSFYRSSFKAATFSTSYTLDSSILDVFSHTTFDIGLLGLAGLGAFCSVGSKDSIILIFFSISAPTSNFNDILTIVWMRALNSSATNMFITAATTMIKPSEIVSFTEITKPKMIVIIDNIKIT